MQQWKNKLFNDDNANNANDDVVSVHSAARSNYSRHSKASDSPFLNITAKQTKDLLKG